MSELISGKEAWIKAVNGESVQYNLGMQWEDLTGRELNYWQGERFLNKDLNYKFRLKPRTIKLNGIEVAAPFEPKIGEYVYFISSDEVKGYAETTLVDTEMNWGFVQFGAWRTEEEIKQVVAALRKVFK